MGGQEPMQLDQADHSGPGSKGGPRGKDAGAEGGRRANPDREGWMWEASEGKCLGPQNIFRTPRDVRSHRHHLPVLLSFSLKLWSALCWSPGVRASQECSRDQK